MNRCPLCGETWPERQAINNPAPPAAGPSPFRRVLVIALVSAVVLIGGLVAAVAIGAAILWPAVRSWTATLLGSTESSINSQVRQLAGNSSFERLRSSAEAFPSLVPLVQSGVYLKVLEEAVRQNIGNLADLKADSIASPEIHLAAEQVQQALKLTPGGGGIAGTVDPTILALLKSDTFQLLSKSGLIERLLGGKGGRAKPD